MAQVFGVILAGGTGRRMGAELPKQFLPLEGRPVIAWAMEAFNSHRDINGILIVSHRDYIGRIRSIAEDHNIGKLTDVLPGGETRQGSSYNAVTGHSFSGGDIILIHDAARPFITADMITHSIDAAREWGAAGVYVPAIDTVTVGAEGFAAEIPDRKNLYYTQTPQTFTCGVIRDAHEKALARNTASASDDVQMALDAGYRVKMVEGAYTNIKITTPYDYEAARMIAAKGLYK
jgi:2-C-methyl-D-erythritol 4-phosphate cytidylyltransferase